MKSDWVTCNVCGEDDMWKDAAGIHCTNELCKSKISATQDSSAGTTMVVAYRALATGALYDAAHAEQLWPTAHERVKNKIAPLVYAAPQAAQPADVEGWQPIETAPRRFSPPLSTVDHHAPDILGLWGKAFYSVCSWGGPSQPFWIGGDNKKVPFQPTHWMPLPAAPQAGGKGGAS